MAVQEQWSRRHVLGAGSVALIGSVLPLWPDALKAAAQRVRTKIRDIQTMTVSGDRTYVFIKITTDDGQYGIAEAYGTPGVGVVEQIHAIKPALIGLDPLQIDRIYTFMGDGATSLSGTRTDGSAHMLLRAASGIEMALWDLSGKLLNAPTSVLLGGQFRDRVRVYDHSRPANPLDKGACRAWAAQVRSHPSGFTAHKINVGRTDTIWTGRPILSRADNAHDPANRQLTTKELIEVQQSFENMRDAIGWDHDLMVHCHWEFDLATSIRLAEAVAPVKPLWLEDPLGVEYTDAWKRLCERSPVAILTGENLGRREGFAPFITNLGADIINPDLRNSGGFLETKRIADMAAVYGIPMTVHNTGSQLYTYQACQWAASIRDFMMVETITGEGGWMDEVLRLDGKYIEKGYVKTSDTPGTGVELNRAVVQAHLAPGEKWWGGE